MRLVLPASMCIASVIALTVAGCSSESSLKQQPQQPPPQGRSDHEPGAPPAGSQTTTLVTGGYGYEAGDIVLIDTQKEPALGDVVHYDWGLNNSKCMAMGPAFYLAKIIGRPGDSVKFAQSTFTANGYTGSLEHGAGGSPRTKPTMWGASRHEDAATMTLAVPDGEYLADRWIGQECPPDEKDGAGNSKAYNRFTVKRAAIQGVVVKKLGHDKGLAEQQGQRVY